MLERLKRITLDRGESDAGAGGDAARLSRRLKAKSFSTTGRAGGVLLLLLLLWCKVLCC
jgi:hypothetical protein